MFKTGTSSASPPSVLDLWFARPVPLPDAAVRLFCLPFAGGGTMLFRGWPYSLSDDVEICAVQLPGRESRLRENAYTCLSQLVSDLADVMAPLLDRPYAIFGHSMGGLITFELARELIARGHPVPLHLFVSGRRAAHIEDTDLLHELSDEDFQKGLRRFNGLSEKLFKNERLMRFFLPTLRADFTLFETHSCPWAEPLPCPISVFGGEDDAEATADQLSGWQAHTSMEFFLRVFPGGHFFLRDHGDEMLCFIEEDLRRSLSKKSVGTLVGGPERMGFERMGSSHRGSN